MIALTVLGSGSSGNCALVESGATGLLIDAGFSGKQIGLRMQSAGKSLDAVHGVALTHEHGDHVAGLAVLCQRRGLPLYCNRATAEELRDTLPKFRNWHLFETGQTFEVGDMRVETFSVPHDAADPVGFVVRNGTGTVGFVTDLGHATKLVVARARDCDALVVEANHDPELLQGDAKRPWATKQRIRSRHGHLDNAAAGRLVAEVVSDRLRHVVLGHLSRDCNTPDLAERAVRGALESCGAPDIQLSVASQDAPMPTIRVGG